MNYGYIRVSSKEQNVERQIIAVTEYVADEKCIFIDKQSGKNFERPAYKKLLKKLKEKDVIIVKSIDRLGRNYNEILEQWRMITKVKKADIFVIDFPLLDTRKKDADDLIGTFISDLVLQILSYVAQTEREFIHQRQQEGIEAAKERGVKFGRPNIELPDNFYECADLYKIGAISLSEASTDCGMSKTSFYRYTKKI